jgi:uncharacterized protein YehS (DUF1456 family)
MKMNNNDILKRVRYALDIKDNNMVSIFELGGVELTKEEVHNILKKTDDDFNNEENSEDLVSNAMLDAFLNGLITYKRGKQDPKPGQTEKPILVINDKYHVNNVLLKKLKIALTLTSEDMLDILELTGVVISKGELSAVLRKEGERHYKECGDRYARNFLKGLAIKYRKL